MKGVNSNVRELIQSRMLLLQLKLKLKMDEHLKSDELNEVSDGVS